MEEISTVFAYEVMPPLGGREEDFAAFRRGAFRASHMPVPRTEMPVLAHDSTAIAHSTF